jgi:hypothetical protein
MLMKQAKEVEKCHCLRFGSCAFMLTSIAVDCDISELAEFENARCRARRKSCDVILLTAPSADVLLHVQKRTPIFSIFWSGVHNVTIAADVTATFFFKKTFVSAAAADHHDRIVGLGAASDSPGGRQTINHDPRHDSDVHCQWETGDYQ